MSVTHHIDPTKGTQLIIKATMADELPTAILKRVMSKPETHGDEKKSKKMGSSGDEELITDKEAAAQDPEIQAILDSLDNDAPTAGTRVLNAVLKSDVKKAPGRPSYPKRTIERLRMGKSRRLTPPIKVLTSNFFSSHFSFVGFHLY